VVKADASRQRLHNDDDDFGGGPGVREYLDAISKEQAPTTPTPPKRISPTDPQARWTAAPGGPAFYAYSTNYLIDTEAGIIVDVEATPAHRSQEVESTKTMIERVKERFELPTKKLIGDYRLRHGGVFELDGERARHRATRAGVGEGRTIRRHVLPFGFRI